MTGHAPITAFSYSSPEKSSDISRTSGGHKNAWARPFTHQIPSISAGWRQKAISRFITDVTPRPMMSSPFGWSRSPKQPLKSCPAP